MDKSVENNEPIKNRQRFKKFLNIFILVFAIVLLAVEGVVYYQRSYLTPFWVNGQSMYPTLNGNAYDANGNKLTELSGSAGEGYIIDYGVMDTHKAALKKIKRFDIVVTKYSKTDTKNKIKRIIGLPGETVHFATDTEHRGDLYINDTYIEQPISLEFVRKGAYSSKKVILGEDEYFVCGDNRGHSSDSREEGPVKKEYITGKVVAICGTAQVYYDGTHFDIKNIKYKWPRKVK